MLWYRLSRPGPLKSARRRSVSKSSRPTAAPGSSTNAPVFAPQALKAWARKVALSKWRWPATCSLVTSDAPVRSLGSLGLPALRQPIILGPCHVLDEAGAPEALGGPILIN